MAPAHKGVVARTSQPATYDTTPVIRVAPVDARHSAEQRLPAKPIPDLSRYARCAGLRHGEIMADKKTVFVAFAMEDERQRDFLKGQSLLNTSPFEYIDLSVKEAYERDWKDKVRARIRRSDGVIVLVSKHSPLSTGQAWEISCAKEEKKKILAIRAYRDDTTYLSGVNTVDWDWDNIRRFINGL